MIVKLVIVAAAIYTALGLSVYFFQNRLVFIPSRDMLFTPQSVGLDYEELNLPGGVNAWFVPHPDARFTLLFCHGNAGNISHRLESLEIFHALGLNTLIFDYSGYGKSTGQPSEAATYENAAAVWNYLTQTRGIEAHRIVVFGRSLGSGVATWIGEQHAPGALVLESPITSVPDMGRDQYPFLPVRWLARIHYDNLARIRSIRVPLMILHSPDDRIVGYEHGQRLFEAANEPKRFAVLEGGHNDAFLVTGQRYLAHWRGFLDDLPH